MTLPAAPQSTVIVAPNTVTPLGNVSADSLIINDDTNNPVFVSASSAVSATSGIRLGPLGSVVWSDASPCFVWSAFAVQLTVTGSSSNVSNPLDVADAIHRDGISISGPVSITGTVPVSGDVNISSPVSIAGTVPVSGDVNVASITGTVDIAVPAGSTLPINVPGNVNVVAPTGTPLEVSVPGTVNIATAGALTVQTTPGSPLDISGSTVNVNPVTISGTVPVSGTVSLGSGTVVGISGGVTISGPVSVSGGVTVNNVIGTVQPMTFIGGLVSSLNSTVTKTIDVSSYNTLIVQLYGSINGNYQVILEGIIPNGNTTDPSAQFSTQIFNMILLNSPTPPPYNSAFNIPNGYQKVKITITGMDTSGTYAMQVGIYGTAQATDLIDWRVPPNVVNKYTWPSNGGAYFLSPRLYPAFDRVYDLWFTYDNTNAFRAVIDISNVPLPYEQLITQPTWNATTSYFIRGLHAPVSNGSQLQLMFTSSLPAQSSMDVYVMVR